MEADLYTPPLFTVQEMKDLIAPPPECADMFIVRAFNINLGRWALRRQEFDSPEKAEKYAHSLGQIWRYPQIFRLSDREMRDGS